MNTDKLEVLQEMYSLCIQNRKEEKKKIQTNLDRISEIDAYIKSIKESEEADFKIFSPRSSERVSLRTPCTVIPLGCVCQPQ